MICFAATPCTRADLLSGNIGRILRIHPSQAIFLDRIVLANFVASGITVWGEAMGAGAFCSLEATMKQNDCDLRPSEHGRSGLRNPVGEPARVRPVEWLATRG